MDKTLYTDTVNIDEVLDKSTQECSVTIYDLYEDIKRLKEIIKDSEDKNENTNAA